MRARGTGQFGPHLAQAVSRYPSLRLVCRQADADVGPSPASWLTLSYGKGQ